ncbi:MAG: 3-isopropylmalate dehydratase small subunit [Hyphomicrobiaceae bacterium]|nr:3-isopropylmalate dehydratase small subunit [Hyphomicrobiaceae bacterium]
MDKFLTLRGIACPLEMENVDTDQLIPARFLSRSRADGYGGFLLHDLRFDAHGRPRGFTLDEPRYAGASVVVARRNFGTGSSREAAVYALWDYGVRCVVAPSFGDIFSGNAVKNGLLTAVVPEPDAEALLAWLRHAGAPELTVDLEGQTIVGGGLPFTFSIDPVRRLRLLNGWDDLDLTLQYTADIAAFREARCKAHRWAFPALPPVERDGNARS